MDYLLSGVVLAGLLRKPLLALDQDVTTKGFLWSSLNKSVAGRHYSGGVAGSGRS